MENRINKGQFIVNRVKKETEDVVTIFLSATDKTFTFQAGQYVSVYLDKDKNSQAKFYTISSAPEEKKITLSVKKIGNFSSALHNLKVSDPVYLSGPFGWFYPNKDMDNLVFLAAGIGIAPFLSIIKDCQNKNIKKKVDIFYTNKTLDDISFFEDMNKIAEKNDKLKVHYCLTRDKVKNEFIDRYERLDIKYLKEKLGDLTNKNFYICGPISFVSDFRKQLLVSEVKEENIFTESFF
ncbi:MAG: FAD-dependent oxidoreductase [Candidatus Zambryskibacteria bacterium]|nr:FAD-dependent oxidoreductase [Candidatus Zambryskibacteria bacterium]